MFYGLGQKSPTRDDNKTTLTSVVSKTNQQPDRSDSAQSNPRLSFRRRFRLSSSMEGFDKRKASILSTLGFTHTDKSPKGSLDTPIIPLLNAINLHPSYYTTSSCSGRISILSTPTSSTVHKKARGGSWLYITHDFADKNSIMEALFDVPDDDDAVVEEEEKEGRRCDVVFRFEPLIVAVECRDLAAAQNLVAVAIGCGFRESGITSVGKRVIVGIRCSIRMEVPLGEKGRILATREFLGFLVEVANRKMEANRKRTDGFFQALLEQGFAATEIPAEISEGKQASDEGRILSGSLTGSLEVYDQLKIVSMKTIGENVERLFIWGHTTCTLDDERRLLVYGGFGGMGRHARRNDCLRVNPLLGELELVKVENSPPPRLGHSASMVGKCMFVIGGRADPTNILNDVWVFDTVTNKWKQLECNGSSFAPR